MNYSWQIGQGTGLALGTSALYYFSRTAIESGAAYDTLVSEGGDRLTFSVDTWLDDQYFRVELRGAGFSNDPNDPNFSINRIHIALVDSNHPTTSPLFYWMGDTNVQFSEGEATHIEVINYQWDGSQFQTELNRGIDKLKARLDIFSNWSDLTNELWTRIANNKWYYEESVNSDGSTITRKYYLASNATGSANAIAEVFVRGQSLSLDRFDENFTVSSVDGTVTFILPELGDDNVATFSLDFTQEVSAGWVTKLALNGGHVSFSGLTAWLDSEWDQGDKKFNFEFATTGFSVAALIDGLGLDAWTDRLASLVNVNADGTEIMVTVEPSSGLSAQLILKGSGFSSAIDDADFDLTGVRVSVFDQTQPNTDPLMFFERTLNLSVREGSWSSTEAGPELPPMDAPASATLSVSGQARTGGALSLSVTNLNDPDGLPTLARQWQWLNGETWLDISDATGGTWAIPAGGLWAERTVRVQLSTTDPLGGTSLFYSEPQAIEAIEASSQLVLSANHWKAGKGPLAGVDLGILQGGHAIKTGADGRANVQGLTDPDGQGVGQTTLQPTLEVSRSQAGINLTDVLGALKVYLGKPLPDAYNSDLKYIAADFDGNGSVNLSDVLGLLKFYLGKPVNAAPTWVFVDSAQTTDVGGQALHLSSQAGQPLSKTHAAPAPIHADLNSEVALQLVGVLRGDVDGSWVG